MRGKSFGPIFGATLAVFVACSLLGFGVQSAFADAFNTRPIAGLNETGANGEDTLQEVFDNITTSGPGIDASDDQSSAALFTNQGSGGAVATFIIAIAGNAEFNDFGIYEAGDSSNRAVIFSGEPAFTQALVSFDANGDIYVNGDLVGSDFGDAFGFYLSGPGGTYFTEDTLNPNGDPQALVFQGDGETNIQIDPWKDGTFATEEWIIAFEDREFANSDKDFNDLVVLVESIEPVPEPSSLLLLGSGLVGLGIFARRRRRLAKA